MYDVLGLRVVLSSASGAAASATDKVAACQHVEDVVHRLWSSVHSRRKDYILAPKANGYQSLHLAVCVPPHILEAASSGSSSDAASAPHGTSAGTGAEQEHGWPPGTLAELQIRTDDMHAAAETGASAHFAYKGGLDAEQTRRLQAFTGQLMQVRPHAPDIASQVHIVCMMCLTKQIRLVAKCVCAAWACQSNCCCLIFVRQSLVDANVFGAAIGHAATKHTSGVLLSCARMAAGADVARRGPANGALAGRARALSSRPRCKR